MLGDFKSKGFFTVQTKTQKSLFLVLLLTLVSASSYADSDDKSGGWWPFGQKERGYQAANTQQPEYHFECGACHMPYPAQLLPKAGWQRILGTLDNHFGEDATLTKTPVADIEAYLVANAADSNNAGKFSNLLRGLKTADPIRITELPYYKHKHDEIDPKRMVLNNPDVGSFSECNACHGKAVEGVFDEHTVKIPNFNKRDY